MTVSQKNTKEISPSAKPAKSRFIPFFIASFFVITLPACGSSGGGGSGDAEGAEPTVEVATDSNSEASSELSFLGSGESVTGSLSSGEFVTYRVPSDSQIVLRSDSGNSDLLLLDTQEFLDESVVCIENLFFQEDICSGNNSGEDLYATVVSTESGDYTLTVTNDCSVDNINQWVYRSMQDYYLFADQVPTLNPADYDSPSELVNDLKLNELDPFSSIFNSATGIDGEPLAEGKAFGLGHIWARNSTGELRVLDVHTDSPLGRNGVKRGDIFRSFGGIIDDDLTNEQFLNLLGPDEDPNLAEWSFEDGETGELKTFVVAKAEYTVNTVSFSAAYTNTSFDGVIGYIVFNRFLLTSAEELDRAINELSERNISELVLDLRYNGGGRVAIADRLAAQLSGNRLTGQVLSQTQFNDTYSHLDGQVRFADALPTLDLSRVIVLTTPSTASASETVINALKPYMEVVTIGGRSSGKPFTSNFRNFCGMTLNAMHSQNVNAQEVSVAGGIEATCFAEDDITRNYGIANMEAEGMFGSALEYVLFGTCDAPPLTALASRHSIEINKKEWEKTGALESFGPIPD